MSSKTLVKSKKVTTKSAKRRKVSDLPTGRSSRPATPSPIQRLTRAETARKREPLGHLVVEKLLRESGFKGIVSSAPELLEKYAKAKNIESQIRQGNCRTRAKKQRYPEKNGRIQSRRKRTVGRI